MANKQISVTRSQVIKLSHLRDVTIEIDDSTAISVVLRNCTDIAVSVDNGEGNVIEDKQHADIPIYGTVTLK